MRLNDETRAELRLLYADGPRYRWVDMQFLAKALLELDAEPECRCAAPVRNGIHAEFCPLYKPEPTPAAERNAVFLPEITEAVIYIEDEPSKSAASAPTAESHEFLQARAEQAEAERDKLQREYQSEWDHWVEDEKELRQRAEQAESALQLIGETNVKINEAASQWQGRGEALEVEVARYREALEAVLTHAAIADMKDIAAAALRDTDII